MRRLTSILVVATALLGACATTVYPFPNRSPMWVDHDRHPFADKPSPIFTPPRWDVVDAVIFRPMAEVWTFRRGHESVNVNAVDEVPNSSWFTNRVAGVGPREIDRGACGDVTPPPKPWDVIRRKTQGLRPGFIIRAADGREFFVRTDETLPERSTAADAIATRLFWAAGYNGPCNFVDFFREEDLVLAPDPGEDAEDIPTQDDINRVIDHCTRAADGSYRVSVGQRVAGEGLGGWEFWGVNDQDRNDVVPHEDRREVRGMWAFSAWLDHIDSRSENNLDVWVSTGDGRGYVRHYVLDASDSFGVVFAGNAMLSQSFGNSYYLDLQHLVEDFLTLGLLDRPYRVAEDELGMASNVLGYYDVERFDPDRWRMGYPNPAFDRATERDKAWMARIIARLDRDDVEAAIRTGHFSRALYSGELARIMMGRRYKLLDRYLTRLSPLAQPTTEGNLLCLTDMAVVGGIRDAEERRYTTGAWQGWPPAAHAAPPVAASGEHACVQLPSAPSSAGRPSYWIVDVVAATPGRDTAAPARVHLYQTGPASYRVVGLERPNDDSPPQG